jgi:hypothetical protein
MDKIRRMRRNGCTHGTVTIALSAMAVMTVSLIDGLSGHRVSSLSGRSAPDLYVKGISGTMGELRKRKKPER